MGGKHLPHPTAYMFAWRALLDDSALLGLQLDDVLEGADIVPVPSEPSHEGMTLPPLSAGERAEIERAHTEAQRIRERRLFVMERRAPSVADECPRLTPQERATLARVSGAERVAREREVKQARVREVIARHLAQTGAPRAKGE